MYSMIPGSWRKQCVLTQTMNTAQRQLLKRINRRKKIGFQSVQKINSLLYFPWHNIPVMLRHTRCNPAHPCPAHQHQGKQQIASAVGSARLSRSHPLRAWASDHQASRPTSFHRGRHAPKETLPAPRLPSPYSARSLLYRNIMSWTYGHDSYPPKELQM